MNRWIQIALLTSAFSLFACTTKTVKMTDEETNACFDYYSDVTNFGKGPKLEWMRFRNYYEKTTGGTWDVECKGASNEVTCWKTPTALSQELGFQ